MKRLFVVLIWLCAAALLGYWVSTSWLPDRIRSAVEIALGEALGGPVHVEAVRVHLGLGAVIEAERLEAWPLPDGPALRADAVRASLDGLALLLGRVHVSGVELGGASLRLARSETGVLTPRELWTLLGGGTDASGTNAGSSRTPRARVREALHALGGLALPDLAIGLSGARIVWRDAFGRGAPIERTLVLSDARVSLGTAPGALRLSARATLLDEAGRERGEVAVEAERTGPASAHAVLTSTRLDLAAVAAYADAALPGGLRGELTGSLEVRIPGAEDADPAGAPNADLELDAQIRALRLAPAGPQALPFETREASLRASLSVLPDRLLLRRGELETGEDQVTLRGVLPQPLRDEAPAELTLRLQRLTLARARALAAHLPRDARAAAERALAPLESGEIGPLEIRGAAPLGRWRTLVDSEGKSFPSELALETQVRDVALKLDGGDRLEGVSGSVRFAGDRLDLRGVKGTLGGQPLPVLDVSFSGVDRLLGAERFAARPPTPAQLPGLRPLQRFLSRDPADPDLTPHWTRLRVDADFLHHPALVLPLEDAHAEIAPTRDGVHWIVERARFGGVPIDAEGDYLDPPNERVVLSVRAVGAREPRPKLDFRGDWGRARFALVMAERPAASPSEAKLSGASPSEASLSGASGWARVSGASLRLFDSEVWLRGEGVLRGDAVIDLSARDSAPYDLRFTLAQPNAGDISLMLGADETNLSGRVEARGTLQGRLAPGHSMLDGARGAAHVVARDGDLRQRMPLFVAIASVSETLNPFAKRDRIRYREAEGDLALEANVLSSEAIAVDSPDLRLFVSGTVAITPPYDTRAVVGLFFFGKLSSMIDLVPIVNRVLLGENQSLVGAYFQLAGAWTSPTATLIPLRSLTASGPASLVLEGLPSFVRGGVEAIEAMLGRGAAAEPRREPDPPPAVPPGSTPDAAP